MLLAYCVGLLGDVSSVPAAGVRGARVETLPRGGVEAFYSETGASDLAGEDAAAFHRVISNAFAGGARDILPFRFATLFEDFGAFARHLEAQADRYRGALERARGTVRLDLRISTALAQACTGSDYLLERQRASQRLQAAAEAARGVLAPWLREWRSDAAAGDAAARSLRAAAVVAHQDLQSARAALGSATAPEGVKLVVTGPWPSADLFLQPEAQAVP